MLRSVADYPMAGYHQGIHQPGKFHLMTFADSEREGHDRHVPHRHDFFELVWLRTGSGRVCCDLEGYSFHANSLLILSPGQVHAWRFTSETQGQIVGFSPEFLAVNSEHPGLLAKMPFLYPEHLDPILYLDTREGERIDGLFAQLNDLAQVPAPGRDDVVRGFLLVLLSYMRQLYAHREQLAPRPRHENELLVQRFRLALEEHLPRVVEVGEFAELLNVSRTHLNNGLRRFTGRSASELIHERMLLEAKRRLLHSSLTIAEIAYELQFQDPSYFGRFFRKYTGVTPGEYRGTAQHEALAS
ncbi:AraC family transcriptional regulator [Synoicihabitans lomoniglobus]|uniref:AraC family transcriptional regulator n=1 Tax=Synoicihabitans lomoniglobus TaxID=2909285 RepID=A0AAF0I7C2_9BACT|nr:AraC family transcriptional regulator [Opitutaceae bacterium LMO-M01]WED66631.1 AraC family transcriptional regulator [Opitutaceae bacterium LMO-M01]